MEIQPSKPGTSQSISSVSPTQLTFKTHVINHVQSNTSDRHVECPACLRGRQGNDPPKCSQRLRHIIKTARAQLSHHQSLLASLSQASGSSGVLGVRQLRVRVGSDVCFGKAGLSGDTCVGVCFDHFTNCSKRAQHCIEIRSRVHGLRRFVCE